MQEDEGRGQVNGCEGLGSRNILSRLYKAFDGYFD